jgi:hypothetical protein
MTTDISAGRWAALALVVAGLVLAALVVFTPNTDLRPSTSSSGADETAAQPVQPATPPSSAPPR